MAHHVSSAPKPPTLVWYDAHIDAWAGKEKQAVRLKLAEYLGTDAPDNVFAILEVSAQGAQSHDPWDAWGVMFARHDTAVRAALDSRDMPMLRPRLADLLGYCLLGLAKLAADTATPPSS